jgi:hypothetical protein
MSFTIGTVVLRNPDLADGKVSDLNRVVNRTMANYPLTKSDWPTFIQYNYNFSVIKRTLLVSLVAYLRANRGKVVSITDHNGDTYSGVVVMDSIDVTTVRATCSYSFGITIYRYDTPAGYLLAAVDQYLLTDALEKILLRG